MRVAPSGSEKVRRLTVLISLSFQFTGQATCGSGDYSMHIKYRLS